MARHSTYICGGKEFAGATHVDLQRSDCPNERNHAPMPQAYIAWGCVADMREQAGQRQETCLLCEHWTIWCGGRDVLGWPRRMATVEHQRQLGPAPFTVRAGSRQHPEPASAEGEQ